MIYDFIIWIPLLIGFILLIFPERIKSIKAAIALFTGVFVFYHSILLYFGLSSIQNSTVGKWLAQLFDSEQVSALFLVDSLNTLIVTFIGFFTFLILVYALVFISKKDKCPNYFSFILLTLGASNGAALADNMLLFLGFWSFLAISLYQLIPSNNKESSAAATKSLIIIGASDVIMLFGIAIIWSNTNLLAFSKLNLETDSSLNIIAFIALLIGAFTKAGAFPFHSWIPDFTQEAPATSSAYLPASLDKLLGIYFMARLINDVFTVNQWLTLAIIIVGVSTIISGVMMALIQHDYKKLLGFHAVSQVGYMITGLGLGSALGLIGGLFHMINNALYKSGLFLSAGSVEKQSGHRKIEDLGGLSKNMPVTFVSALVFALAISGIPPMNGFASKWIIYQAIIDFGKTPGIANNLWILWLALAVIGSALTLASFIKFISGIFLGRQKEELVNVKEAKILMQIPMLIIAVFCIGFGVFATNYVVPFLFKDIVPSTSYIGTWNSVQVSLLIVLSIVMGLIIYALTNVKGFRRDESFVGGEMMSDKGVYEVTGFYKTISDAKPLSFIYHKAEHKWFDIYELSKTGVLRLTQLLKRAHHGVLQTYAIWLIIGLILMMILLLLF
ncbi:hypothetical protein HZR84_00095 [Hyphobacterium sp. CCMP332]|nr:hypothetical protein HZR84_00095 [Hyphobacterium sp. CCMP332]